MGTPNGKVLLVKTGSAENVGLSAKETPGLSRRDIVEIFNFFTGIYGYRAERQFDPETNGDLWLSVLAGLSSEDVKRGVKECIERSRENYRNAVQDWPPTAGEFLAMCEGIEYGINKIAPAELREREIARVEYAKAIAKMKAPT